jgi:surface protein
MKKASILILFALLTFGMTVWAQNTFGNLPAKVNADDATITEMGHATITLGVQIVTDSMTRQTDTLFETTNIEWHTEPGTAKRRNAERERSGGSDFYNGDSNWWLDIYWYNFNYPSINAEGEPVMLSSMACMPDEDCDYINNVIIGCHVTITSNKECPSSYTDEGNAKTDVSLLMNHAGSGLVFHSAQSDRAYYNLVIMPDYEGYGITRSHAHPYLYQELTARQVVDGVRYGIALYQNSIQINNIRHPFRSGWRSICVGYSQGGSVAMATHRFIEQNNLTDELQLAGSVCGDGPYDPVATLMYYVKQYDDDNPMSMPVVLPLILKGMCDWNPYMKNHQVSEYLKDSFLASGILTWLTEKEKTTDDITEAWETFFGDHWPLKLNAVINQSGLDFFQALYTAYSDTYTSTAGVPLPTQRSLMQDLQFALASNNLTKGWTPQHAMFLYHSYDDSVVPEVNRESAGNSFGEWVIKLHASGAAQFDHVGTGRQFFLGLAEFAAIRELADAPVHQTLQDAIDMKNDIWTGAHTLDPWENPPVIDNGIVKGTVSLNGTDIPAEYVIKDGNAHLGSGNNACISQYSEGVVDVPATITVSDITYEVIGVSAMAFRLCSQITEVVLPENVEYIGNFAFKGCRALTKVTLPSTLVTLGTGAFIDLPSLHTIDCRATTPPDWEYNDVFKFHTGGIGDSGNYSYDIHLIVPEGYVSTYSNRLITKPDLGWTTPDGWGYFTSIGESPAMNAEPYVAYYSFDHSLTFYYDSHRADRVGMQTYSLDASSANPPGFPAWHAHRNDVTKVVFTPLFHYARPTSTAKWFCDFSHLTSIEGWEHLVTDEVTAMNHMFRNCAALTDEEFDFSHLNTASVTNMQNMFEGCVGLVQPDLSHFDTHSCTTMENMFYGCTQLTFIDLGSFETTECNFDYMFWGCTNLESVNLGSFGVTDSYICESMFHNCTKLSTIVIPSAFNKLKNVFKYCTSLTTVYCYKPAPFAMWNGCDNDFASGKVTEFHVLASTLEAWETAYGENAAVPAKVTFVGDLGTEEIPFPLYSTTDWETFRQMVDNGLNVSAKMMNDFSVTTMMGTHEHPFIGTFDGNGHTLTVNYVITTPPDDWDYEKFAPAAFHFIRNATIKNLHVAGTISAPSSDVNRDYPGGLVGICWHKNIDNEESPSSNSIINCRVSTEINGYFRYFGGIIGFSGKDVSNTVRGCLFDGKFIFPSYWDGHSGYGGVITNEAYSANQTIEDCMENGTYENVPNLSFCVTYSELYNHEPIQHIFPDNSYHPHDMGGYARRAYSLTTDTEGLKLDFGEPNAIYNVSGITAYSTGLKLGDVFYAGNGQWFSVAISASGYDYSIDNMTISGNATAIPEDDINFIVSLALSDAVISIPGMVFTTVILYDDATDNTVKLYQYLDQTYKVQLMGHTIPTANKWNPLCLPFDLPTLTGTPLEGATLKVLDTITFENKVAIFHFKDTTAICADRNYLVRVPNDIESPIFNNVTIKRSLPPGMKNELDEFSRSGFSVMGNYNRINLREIVDTDDPYIALYFDNHGTLRVASFATEICAFQCFLEILNVDLDSVVACAFEIEDDNNFFKVINDEYVDIDNIFVHDGDWNNDSNWAKDMLPNDSHQVLIEGKATVPSDYIAEVDEITIDAGSITIVDGGQLVHSNAGVVATVEKSITGHGGNNNGGWNFIATPIAVGTTPSTDNGLLDATPENYDLYYYHEETHKWRNYKGTQDENHADPGFILNNGQGYLYANQATTTLSFTGALQAGDNGTYTINNLSHSATELTGFNLVGNPFACNATIDRPAYVINGRNVVAYSGDQIVLAPCEGVIVQADAEHESVTFSKVLEAPESQGRNLQITLSQVPEPVEGPTRNGNGQMGGVSTSLMTATLDKAIVSFTEGNELGKFYFDEQNANIYIPQDGKKYAIACVGRDIARYVSTEANEMPINFKVKQDGTYTLTVNPEGVEMAYLHLIDNMTGADIDLLQTPSYTFTGKTTDYESRFRLVFVCRDANDENDGDNEAFAFISNGNIIVNGEGMLQVIDVTGRVVSSGDAMNRVSTGGFVPGVYVLRLINGDDVKTQKMFIE